MTDFTTTDGGRVILWEDGPLAMLDIARARANLMQIGITPREMAMTAEQFLSLRPAAYYETQIEGDYPRLMGIRVTTNGARRARLTPTPLAEWMQTAVAQAFTAKMTPTKKVTTSEDLW